jgi:signal transduction histidine kinase
MTVDRDGAVWFAIREGQLVRINAPPLRNFGVEEGLPGPVAYSVAPLRDGSILAALQAGIAHFPRKGSDPVLDGTWKVRRYDAELGWAPRAIAEGPARGPAAGIWLASERLLRGGPLDYRVLIKGDQRPDSDRLYQGPIFTRSGDLWVALWEVGLLRFPRADVARPPEVIGPGQGICGANLVHGLEASDGSLWFGSYYGSGTTGVTRVQDGRARCLGPADGLPPLEIGAVTEDTSGSIWLGTSWGRGLVRFRDGRFRAVPPSLGLPRASITGLLDDRRGHLWIGSEAGVWRVPREDLDRCADGPCAGVRALVYGKEQGMRTAECTGAFHPNLTLDDQGNVWVATLKGLTMFAPPERARAPRSTPLIDEIAIDGVPTDIGASIRLGPRNRDLVVRYGAASFGGTAPSLRHRLRGFDADWVVAGPQPVAHYHDLPAGSYALEIRTGPGEALLTLGVLAEPPFWRTRSFLILALGLLVTAGLGLHGLRVGQLTLRHRAVNAERARFARELHDGLAQKLRTIGLLSDRMRLGSAPRSKGEIGRLGEIVREAHAELNRAIWDIRDARDSGERLETAIERALSELGVPSEIAVSLRTSGDSLPVRGLAAHEVPLVVKEAVTNAVRHARPSQIEVGMLCDEDELQVWVRDDGVGFSTTPCPHREGGHGIVGMHERARRLGGRLTIRSAPGEGTEVSLLVPQRGHRREGGS